MEKIVSSKELAEILGVTVRRIQQLSTAPENVIKKLSRGKFHLAESIQKYISYQLELERKKFKKHDMDINEARRRREIAEAELKEIELEKERGILIDKEMVIETWQKILGILRTRLLSLPSQTAPQLIGMDSISKINNELKKYIYNMLKELSESKNVV